MCVYVCTCVQTHIYACGAKGPDCHVLSTSFLRQVLYSILLFCSCDKSLCSKSSLERKGLFHPTVPQSITMEAKVELKVGAWDRSMRSWYWSLTSLLLGAQGRPTAKGWCFHCELGPPMAVSIQHSYSPAYPIWPVPQLTFPQLWAVVKLTVECYLGQSLHEPGTHWLSRLAGQWAHGLPPAFSVLGL